MNDFIFFSIAATGVWMIVWALLMNVTGSKLWGGLVFKVIPFFMGLALLFDAYKLYGVL